MNNPAPCSFRFILKVQNIPRYILNRTRFTMHKIKSIFHHHHHHGNVEPEDKKRQSPYPWSLEKNYHISKKVLGRGSFGVVRQCTDKRTGKDYALKIIDKKSIRGKEQMLTTELDVLKKVHHPNVITLHELIDTKKAVYIITDLASGGELFDQLLKKGSYTERDASNLVRQILEGVAYLHDHEIVHRDLKPENLLFSDKSDHPSLMITDFGLSKVLRHHNDILTTACGTPGYVAPEVLRKNGYGRSVDVWSIGVIMYTLLCGYTPFWGEDQGELFESILSGVYYFEEEYWSGISDFAKDLIDKMLAYDAKKRITVHQALQHPWFEMADNIDLLSNVRKNFSARATFRKAINVVQGVNRLKKNSVQLHITKQRNVSTDNPSSANANDADISDLDLDLQLTSMSRKDSETLGPTASSPLPKLEDDVDVIEENWFSNNNVILIR